MKQKNNIYDLTKFESEHKKIFFNFTFLTDNVKQGHSLKKVIDKIKIFSQLSLKEIKSLPREKGLNYINKEKCNIFFFKNDDLCLFVDLHLNEKISNKIEKYAYFRIGPKERMYGVLVKNNFIAIYLDTDKKVQ